MSLRRTDFFEILKITEDNLLANIKKSGKTYVEKKVIIIERALLNDKEKYLGTGLDIDFKNLKQNIRKMFGKTPPVEVDIIKRKGDQFNMSVDSVDLNTSSMSYDDNDTEVELDPLFKNSKKELVRQLRLAKNQNSVQETELNFLRPIGNFFKCEQKRGGFSYMPAVDRIAVSLLSEGELSRGIVRFFEALASEFPVLKTSDCEMKKNIPRKSYINSLRDVLPNLNSLHLSTFLENTTRKKEKLTLSVDQTTISSNTGIMGMGVSDQSGNFHLIGLMQTTASKGLEIKEAMKQLLKNTGYHQQILNMSVALISDRCAAQISANNFFINDMKDEFNVEINYISCYMHTTSNCEKNFCEAFEKEMPTIKDALHKGKILFGARKTMGYQRNSLKNDLDVAVSGSKSTIFVSDKGSRYGVLYENSRNFLNHKEAVLCTLKNSKTSNVNAVELKKLIDDCWPKLSIGFGAICLYWSCVLSPFHSGTSKKMTIRETLELMTVTKEKMDRVRDSESSYEELYSFRLENELSPECEKAISISYKFGNRHLKI